MIKTACLLRYRKQNIKTKGTNLTLVPFTKERVCHQSMAHPLSLIISSLYYFSPLLDLQHTFEEDD